MEGIPCASAYDSPVTHPDPDSIDAAVTGDLLAGGASRSAGLVELEETDAAALLDEVPLSKAEAGYDPPRVSWRLMTRKDLDHACTTEVPRGAEGARDASGSGRAA